MNINKTQKLHTEYTKDNYPYAREGVGHGV